MKKDIISPQISQRLFFAIEQLTEAGQLNGVPEFSSRYGIGLRLAYMQRQEPDRRILRPAWLTYIVRDYGISAEWLLLGEGNMFRSKDKKQAIRAKSVQEIKRLADTLL